MRARWLALVAVPLAVACTREPREPEHRMELKETGAASFQLIPAEGQHPFCLVYTISENGTIRQLTMGRYNESWRCEAGKAIGSDRTFRVPLDEGKVRVLTVFSDQRLAAGPVSDQLFELVHRRNGNGVEKLQVMDMRLPGKVTTDWNEFVPQAEGAAVVGGEIREGGAMVEDAGTPPPADAGTPPPANPVQPSGGATENGN